MTIKMQNTDKQLAIIYARVSSREQEETGYSLDAQEKFLTEYADHKTIEIVKVFRVTESASKWQIRKTLTEMLNYANKQGVGTILCEKIDRLTRNLKDAATVDDWVREEGKNREVHFVKENFVLNKNTKAHENLVWDMKVAIARFYTNNLSEEVQKGQKEKTAQGWLPTKPPLGYRTIGEKGHKIHVIDEKVAPYIREMFALYATSNYSTLSLTKKMYELGFRSRNGGRVVKSKIHKLLSDPFYYGKFVWKGKVYDGKHEPIISRDLFEQVKAKMTRPSAPYHSKHYKELRGKVFCGNCEKTVTWERQRGHWYGACKQCKAQLATMRKYVRQEEVEDALMEKIVAVAPQNERILGILQKALKESHSQEIAYHEAQVNGINASLQRIQQRKQTMYDDKLDGRISADFYDQKLQQFKDEEETLTGTLKKLKADNTEYYKVGATIHTLAAKAVQIYKSPKASIEERRLLLAYAYSNVSVLKGVVTPEYTPAFKFLADWMPKVNKGVVILEPMQKTAETLVSSGDLHIPEPDFPLAISEVQNNSRTSKNGSVNTRPEGLPLTSGILLRG